MLSLVKARRLPKLSGSDWSLTHASNDRAVQSYWCRLWRERKERRRRTREGEEEDESETTGKEGQHVNL